MAQEQNKKINLSSAKTGMVKDTHPSQLTDAEYTHAFNANIENESGNSLNLTNEKSNILASKFKPGFRVIGFENDIDSNSTFFFLVNPLTSVGEFGVIESNQNTNDISDVLVDCDNCNKVNQLSDPLETLTQAPLQTYTTLLTDIDGYLDVNTNLCTPFTPGSGFNFDINYPIKKIVIKNEKCGKNIYFSDNNNPPRHINITELLAGRYNDQNVSCDDNITTTCINYDELRIFKLFSIPKIEPATIELGGRLPMGMYEFLIAYSDASGNEISPYYSITNPIAIFDKNNRILEQKELASRTNLAIRLEVSNLDKTYSHYKVAVIQTADIEGASRYFIEGIHTINDNTVVYATEQNKVTTSFDKLLIDQLNIEKVEGLTASNNILFQYGITQKKEINLQPVMNLLGQFMQWQVHIAPENLYENGVLSSKFLGYNRDEVVPLSIRFLLDGGYETSIFPLISRLSILSDNEVMVEENGDGVNEDVDSIIKNIQSCISVNRDKRWQFYNTAFTESGNTICTGGNLQTAPVTESVIKTCDIEGVGTVGPGMLVIDIDNEDYVGLAQYIEDNKSNCPAEFQDTEICTVLNADYTANSCETNVFEGLDYCNSITETPEIIVGSIEDEVTTEIEKLFPSEYVKARIPKSCTIHKTNQETAAREQDPTNPLGYEPSRANVPRPVYLRDSDFENEDCSYGEEIINYPNTSENTNIAAFNNYYVTDPLPTLDLYATTTASDISGYTVLVRNIADTRYNTTAQDVSTGVITSVGQLVGSLVTDANIISGNPGTFGFKTTLNIRRTSGTGQAEFFFRIYKRNISGTETLISQSDYTLPVTNSGYVGFSTTAIWNNGTFLNTDRVVLKYYANKLASPVGSDPIYEFQFGGASPARSSAEPTREALYTTKSPATAGISGNFFTKIHKGALWFAGKTEGKTKFILDISKQKIADYSDTIGGGSTVRVSIFKSCSDATAIYSKIVDMSSGEMWLLEKDLTTPTTLKITDSTGVVTPIPNGWFGSKKYYVTVEAPIIPGIRDLDPNLFPLPSVDIEDIFIVQPMNGCYTVTKRDIELSRIEVTWDSIRVDKKITYTATCTFNQPVVQSCNAVPFEKGNFAYWESEETYPDNVELYDSRSLSIPENLIPIDVRDKFKDAFVKSIANGNYVLNDAANFTCNRIRHFKFPDNQLAPFMSNAQQSPFGSSVIYPLGITVNEELINAFLDIAVVNGLLSQSDRNKISGYEIFRGDISLDRSVVASGLLYDMRKYKESQKSVYYSNYPFNSYQNDVLNKAEDLSVENGVTFGVSNRNYTFHSPETDYYRQQLPAELSIQGYMFGNSRGHFDEVKGHPKWVILSDKARNLANVLAGLEVTAESIVKTAEVAAAGSGSYAFGWIAFGGPTSGGGKFLNPVGIGKASAATIATAVLKTVTAVAYKYGQYRYQWLKIFRDFGSPHNFAYYYYGEGYYNYILDSPNNEGNKLRGLQISRYLNDGRFITTNETTGERLSINNIDRERSVFLSFGDKPITYPTNINYRSYDKGPDSSITYLSQAGFSDTGRSPEVVKNIASPYAAIKNYLPTQYGTINSIKWLSTGYVGDLKNATDGCKSIFGGDTYISRHTLKRKMPLFLVTAMKQADLTPYNYFFYSNIGKDPRFYCSYEQNKDFSSSGKSFPDIVSNYSFDNLSNSGNYIVPPSKFYLYYYGVTNFLTETRVNTNYRYAGKEQNRNFYPAVGDLGEWTQEESVSIREPNVFLYNSEYSKQISLTRKRTLTDTYERSFNECVQDMPNGIIASLPDNTENSLYDPWLIYRPLDTFEFQTNFGKLKDIIDIEGQAILARFANTSILYNKVDSKIDDGSSPVLSLLGGNSFFQRRSTSFHNTNLGYGGTQNSAFISNEFGHFFADAKRGQVLMVPSNGEGMIEISSMVGNKSSGMRNWFKEHLPFKMLKYIPNVDIDNPYNGLGLTMGWDSRYRRVFLTKRDYIPKNDCIQYIEGQGFVIDQTICNGEEPVVTCPTGYILVGGVCQLESTGLNLCPDGWVYDPLTETCTYTDTLDATCICTADVFASPQTICSGTNTSIALTSTETGIGYSWTVTQLGVTGAASGTNNIISQNLVGQGTATYTITPFEIVSGCQGDPQDVLVTVNAVPNIIATPSSPQTITSPAAVSIALSSGVSGTTFAWTVTADSSVTGATSGSGSTITDTLVSASAASVIYNIVATAPNGCTNTLAYTVNLGATVEECLVELTARVFYDDLTEYDMPYTNRNILVTGTSGSGTLNIQNLAGTVVSYPITFNTSIVQTAADFASTHFVALKDQGIQVYGSSGNIVLQKQDTPAPTVTFSSSSGNLGCTISPASNQISQRNRLTYSTFSALPTIGFLLTVYRMTDTGLSWCWTGQAYVPAASLGVSINTFWSPKSSTTSHTCNRAKYNFMTNGVPIDCYYYPPSSSVLPSPSNVQISTDVVNVNNVGGLLDTQNKIVYQRFTSPSEGKPYSRESFVEYSVGKSAIIEDGLSGTANTLKVRLRGTNIVTNPSINGAPYIGELYDQHSDVVGLQFFINGVVVYEGVIGSKVLEINPCTFVPGQVLTTYESSTGGTGKIDTITIGTQTGTLTSGVTVTPGAVTQNIIVNVTVLGTYDFIGYANGVTFRAKGTFASTGSKTITMEALGTPITAEVSTFMLDLAIPYPNTTNYWLIPPTFNITVL